MTRNKLSCVITTFILYGLVNINQGVYAKSFYDYSAKISVEEIKEPVQNSLFKIIGETPNATLKIRRQVTTMHHVHLTEYYYDKEGEKRALNIFPLCADWYRKNSSDLRYKIMTTFLFPHQSACPMNISSNKVPVSARLLFNYSSFEVPCEPWKYEQVLHVLQVQKPLVSITVNIEMEKKYKCDPQVISSSEDESDDSVSEGKGTGEDESNDGGVEKGNEGGDNDFNKKT